MKARTSTALAVMLVSLFDAAALGAVHIVAPPPATPGLPVLQAAVTAAAPGDIVVVRPGDYYEDWEALTIDKGVTVVCAAPTPLRIRRVLILDVGAGETAVVRGFRLGRDPNSTLPTSSGVRIDGCAGGVWIEDCEVDGTEGDGSFPFGPFSGSEAVGVFDCDAVVLAGCRLTGGDAHGGFYTPHNQPGAHGALVSYSTVTFFDCHAFGAAAISDSAGYPEVDGGAAFFAIGSEVFIAGGSGVSGKNLDGTTSAAIREISSTVTVRDVLATADDVSTFPTAFRGIAIDAPAIENAAALVAVDAQPNDEVFVFVGALPGFQLAPDLDGVGVVHGAVGPGLVHLGKFGTTVGPTNSIPLPALPPSVDGVLLLTQLATVRPTGCSLDGASALVWLASGI